MKHNRHSEGFPEEPTIGRPILQRRLQEGEDAHRSDYGRVDADLESIQGRAFV
jgi:hypothetical protein